MPAYTYKNQQDFSAKLAGTLGLTPLGVGFPDTTVKIGFAAPLSAEDKANLDEFMSGRGYVYFDERPCDCCDDVIPHSLSRRIFTAGLPSSGAPYSTVQAAVDAAEAENPTVDDPCLVLVLPGYYNEDVYIHRNAIPIHGIGGQFTAMLKSLTLTNCTAASIAAFNASGDPTVLVRDTGIANPPERIEIRDITIERRANSPAWVGDALASFRVLGAAENGLSFMGSESLDWRVHVGAAAGAGAGKGGVYGCHANYLAFMDAWITGGVKCYQVAGLWYDFVTSVPSPGGGVATVEMYYDDTGALPEPADTGNYGFNCDGGRIGKIKLSGPAGRCGQDYMDGAIIGDVANEATSASSVSIFHACHVKGAITMANSGPTIQFNGGRWMNPPTGTGVAGFTGAVGYNS